MSRAVPIILLFLTPWILAFTVPSVAEEFKHRDLELVASYPGWIEGLLEAAGLAQLAAMIGGLILFQKRPPPLFWPRALTWWVVFVHCAVVIAASVWAHSLLNLGVFFAGMGLWYLFLSERMRWWGGADGRETVEGR